VRAFEGDIGALPVPELLQFINISGRDGVLVITDATGKARGYARWPGGVSVRISNYEKHGLCHGLRILRFFASRPPTQPHF
jgi:hypothetical protein